ncbi:tetratricopeptide repeat protein [Streptomyces sp. NBC_00199]|uniref:tetratricopeptide repeat protein n=1 Tax=Streptomyces sp. NBC_00199 TaxID=2975678 RepID=UPI00224FE4D6|nr:tetratricopeptide repeat protein [Streptomyces sp. NBC_00199]MCX5269240.1 tetratricopeptide repeat protein [Streptomyces sp. NBC_00199]
MSRLSREKKREQKHADRPVAVAPLDVHVRGGAGGAATIGGVPVAAADGEEIQRAVLGHLHRIALATGHPVLATVHDERIGYVVPLRVDPDGSSHFAAEPLRTPAAPAAAPAVGAPTPATHAPTVAPALTVVAPPVVPDESPTTPRGGASSSPAPSSSAPSSPAPSAPAPVVSAPATSSPVAPVAPAAPAVVQDGDGDGRPSQPRRDGATHLLRPVSEPVRDATPTFPLRTVPETEAKADAGAEAEAGAARTPGSDAAPTYVLRALPDSGPESESATSSGPDSGEVPGALPAPGTVAAPTGVFGPPPSMDEQPDPESAAPAPSATPTRTPMPPPAPNPPSVPIPLPLPVSTASSTLTSTPGPTPFVPEELISVPGLDPDPKPTPARGFDAVAEAVLGDDPRTLQGADGAPALLAEPIARINEAVRAGRTDVATGLAERTVLEASGTLGPEHPEVLRLRELTAYIAYLAGDPLRAFHLSLELARIHRRARDAEGAYGNVQSAAAAWRAVRDPFQGLNLGTELLGLWTELTAEEGPAADDVEELESARARMLRLAARARRAGG